MAGPELDLRSPESIDQAHRAFQRVSLRPDPPSASACEPYWEIHQPGAGPWVVIPLIVNTESGIMNTDSVSMISRNRHRRRRIWNPVLRR